MNLMICLNKDNEKYPYSSKLSKQKNAPFRGKFQWRLIMREIGSVADDLDVGGILEGSSCTLHPFGMRTSVRLEQPEKVPPKKILPPISVTDGGMEMLVRLEQPSKAYTPIFVTVGGMVMLVRLEQP